MRDHCLSHVRRDALHGMKLAMVIALLPSTLALSVPPAVSQSGQSAPATAMSQRLELRTQLLDMLPLADDPPAFVRDGLSEAVQRIEELEHAPETEAFHGVGLSGTWTLMALTEPTHASQLEAFEMRTADVEVLDVEQCVKGDGMTATVDFRLTAGDDDGLRGRYEVDSTLEVGPFGRLDMRTTARRLNLPRAPVGMDVPQLMRVLHARLGPEFRAEDGVRLGLQTMYLDEQMRITRCTTSKLRGECTVHVRKSP